MNKFEQVRINTAHNILWYLEKNTSLKYPEWRDSIIHFFYNLYEIANINYGIDITLKLVDGIDINYENKLVCYLHIRKSHILLHMHKKSLLFQHPLTKNFKNKHNGSWPQMFKLTTKTELSEILKYLKKLKIVSRKEYYNTRRIPARIQSLVFDRDKGKCANCSSTLDLHFDHIIPYSKGGSSTEVHNIQILCAMCNLKKGNRTFL